MSKILAASNVQTGASALMGIGLAALVSLQTPFMEWRSLKDVADSASGGTPVAALALDGAEGDLNQTATLPRGTNYLDVLAVASAAITTDAVVEFYGIFDDGAGGTLLMPLLSASGNSQVTFRASDAVAVDATTYVIAESTRGDHRIDTRGAARVLAFLRTAGASTGTFKLYGRGI